MLVTVVAVLGLAVSAAAQSAGGDGGRFYGQAEYLSWWVKDSPAPVPLVTDNFLDKSPNVFLGGDGVDVGRRNAMRVTLGAWLTEDRTWGLEVSGFYLPTAQARQSVSGSGAPGTKDLFIPFFDPTIPGESSSLLSSSADAFSGAATESLSSRLWGADGNVVVAVAGEASSWHVDVLGGFRYLNLAEKYRFETSSPDLPPGSTTVFKTEDSFDALNEFYGGQVGVRGRYRSRWWLADATVKVAIGAMHQRADILGSLATNFFTPSTVQTFLGGYFAQATNIGSHSRQVFAFVPEVGLNLGFRLTDWAAIVVGYNFLYANNVARPAKQIDRTINPSQSVAISLSPPTPVVGEARPGFKFEDSSFWAHGFNAGIRLSF
jgi:hypothetical protein